LAKLGDGDTVKSFVKGPSFQNQDVFFMIPSAPKFRGPKFFMKKLCINFFERRGTLPTNVIKIFL